MLPPFRYRIGYVEGSTISIPNSDTLRNGILKYGGCIFHPACYNIVGIPVYNEVYRQSSALPRRFGGISFPGDSREDC